MSFSLVISKDKHVAYELGLLHGTGDLSKRPPSLKWFPTTCSPYFLHYRGWKAEGQNSQSPWKWGLSIWHHFCCWDVGTIPLGGLPFPTKRQKSTRSHRVLAFPLFFCLPGMQKVHFGFKGWEWAVSNLGPWRHEWLPTSKWETI